MENFGSQELAKSFIGFAYRKGINHIFESMVREIKTEFGTFGTTIFITTENWSNGYGVQRHFIFHQYEVSKVWEVSKTWDLAQLAIELSTHSDLEAVEIAKQLRNFQFSIKQIRRVFEITQSYDQTMIFLTSAIMNNTSPLDEARAGRHW